MTCTLPRRAARSAAAAATAAAAMMATAPTFARAQTTPVPAAPPPASVAPYRAPVLALVQPPPAALGGALTVPQDRPVVVFRFAQGEPDDPIDAASFRVAVDGHDRTAQFQVAAAEAWGPLGDAGAAAAGAASALTAGPHQVAARVCSSRGACAAVDVAVTALPMAAVEAAPASAKTSRRSRVIALLLQASKKLLAP